MEENTSMMTERNITRVVILVIVFFVLLVLPWLLHGQTPTPQDFSNVDFSKISEADIQKTEEHRNQLLKDAAAAAQSQAAVIQDHSSTLSDIKASTDKTESAFKTYKDAAETQINKGNEAIIALAKVTASLKHVTTQLHRAKLILSGCWLVVCFFLLTKIPKPIGFYIAGALAVGGITFIWLWV